MRLETIAGHQVYRECGRVFELVCRTDGFGLKTVKIPLRSEPDTAVPVCSRTSRREGENAIRAQRTARGYDASRREAQMPLSKSASAPQLRFPAEHLHAFHDCIAGKRGRLSAGRSGLGLPL